MIRKNKEDLEIIGLMRSREQEWIKFLNSSPEIASGSQIDIDDIQSPSKNLASETAHASVIQAVGAMLGVNVLAEAMAIGSHPIAGNTLGPSIRSALLPAVRALSILIPEQREERVRRAAQAKVSELRAKSGSIDNLSELSKVFIAKDKDEIGQVKKRCEDDINIYEKYLGGAAPKETTVVKVVAQNIENLLKDKDPDTGGFIRDLIVRGWVVYSADAHGWTWQNGLKGELATPQEFSPGRFINSWRMDKGKFLADALTVSNITSTAFAFWNLRSADQS